jgi:hypothetical protein
MMSELKIETIQENIADYHFLKKRIIRDATPKKKSGVSDYWIEAYMWMGAKKFCAVIDACWFAETTKEFDDIRKASDFIKKYLYA